MANLYYDVRVDIQKDNVIDSGIRFTQGDSKVIYLRIAVMNGGVKFDASNTTPSINFVKPDGTYVVGTPVAAGDFWIYQILGNELQRAGKVLCDVKFTYESGRVSSSKFTFIVEKDTTISGAAASSSYITPMEELLAEMQNYKNLGMDYAEFAKSYTEGGTGKREGEDTDNAKYYYEHVKAISNVDIATIDKAGLVKPDGTTISIDPDGTIHSAGGSTEGLMHEDDYDSNHDGIVDKADYATAAGSAQTANAASTAGSATTAESLKKTNGETLTADEVTQKLATIPKIVGGDVWTAKAYTKGETCIYNNEAYVCIKKSDSTINPTDNDYFIPISLKELNQSLNAASTAVMSSPYTNYPFALRKKGNIALITGGLPDINTNIQMYDVICSISNPAFKPAFDVDFSMINAATQRIVPMYFKSNGELQVLESITAGTSLKLLTPISYFVN